MKANTQHTEHKNTQAEHTPPIERVALASIADGVIASDIDGQVTLLNQAAARMLMTDPQAAVGDQIHAIFESCSARSHLEMMDALDRLYADPYTHEQSGESTEMTIEVGTRAIQVRLSPMLTEMGQFLGIVTVLRDVTREIEAEQTRNDFVLNISQELRAPLTAIKGYSELLLQQTSGKLDEQQEDFLHIVHNSADRLVALINDLLDISRIDSGQLELDIHPLQMDAIIHDVADLIRPQCDRKGLHLTVEVKPNVGSVLGDKNRITQVVANLAGNACRYTPEGGHITLSLSRSEDEDEVRVDVTDMGPCIAPEDQEHVFQRFHRMNVPTASEIHSTDLGLPIAKMLVEIQGGRMWVESGSKQGNTFSFVLPLHTEAPSDVVSEKAEPLEAKHTVLVIEDDFDVAQLIALQLQQEGFDVLTTELGEEALSLAHTKHIDLITLDMMLPDITGMEVLRRLKTDHETADIPVIIVSVLQPDGGGAGWGAADHITKPFALDKLLDSIRRTLEVK